MIQIGSYKNLVKKAFFTGKIKSLLEFPECSPCDSVPVMIQFQFYYECSDTQPIYFVTESQALNSLLSYNMEHCDMTRFIQPFLVW